MKLGLTLNWAHFRHERNSGALFIWSFLTWQDLWFRRFDKVRGLFSDGSSKRILYYTNLQKNKGLFPFLVSCISAIYFGIWKTKLMTSAYRYYWLWFKYFHGFVVETTNTLERYKEPYNIFYQCPKVFPEIIYCYMMNCSVRKLRIFPVTLSLPVQISGS